jgi:hypothetical protein
LLLYRHSFCFSILSVHFFEGAYYQADRRQKYINDMTRMDGQAIAIQTWQVII